MSSRDQTRSLEDLDLDLHFLLRNDFMSFVRFTFGELCSQAEFIDSPHLALIAAKLEACASGKCKRLILCLPPRSLKSIMVSVAYVAWVLGTRPQTQIICASYGQELADKHARDTRTIMASPVYQDTFQTRLSRQRLSVNDFMTTAGGFRMATSIGGVLTGRGGDLLIIDDPLKPQDAYSESARKAVNEWYDNTLLSRLNNKQDGVIIVVMQRLHQDNLVGHLLEKDAWEVLRLPAIAEVDEYFEAESAFHPVRFRRRVGDVLDSRRDTRATLDALRRSMDEYDYEAQYQQNPQPQGGAVIKADWIRSYTPEEP